MAIFNSNRSHNDSLMYSSGGVLEVMVLNCNALISCIYNDDVFPLQMQA